MQINTINLVGRAGREPDVRYFESGSAVANFTLAVNRRSRDEEVSRGLGDVYKRQIYKSILIVIFNRFKFSRDIGIDLGTANTLIPVSYTHLTLPTTEYV